MAYELSSNVQHIITKRMATGIYASEEELLTIALNKMTDYEEAVADIKKGIADEEDGRTRTLNEAAGSLKNELGFAS